MRVEQAYAVVIKNFLASIGFTFQFPVSMAMEVSAPNTAVRVS